MTAWGMHNWWYRDHKQRKINRKQWIKFWINSPLLSEQTLPSPGVDANRMWLTFSIFMSSSDTTTGHEWWKKSVGANVLGSSLYLYFTNLVKDCIYKFMNILTGQRRVYISFKFQLWCHLCLHLRRDGSIVNHRELSHFTIIFPLVVSNLNNVT